MSDSPNPLAETPMERLEASAAKLEKRAASSKRNAKRLANSRWGRSDIAAGNSVRAAREAADLRWAISEITRLTAEGEARLAQKEPAGRTDPEPDSQRVSGASARNADEGAGAAGEPPHLGLVEECWQNLLDKDDRNSPADYPDMALITRDELANYMADAYHQGLSDPLSPSPPQAPQDVAAVIEQAMSWGALYYDNDDNPEAWKRAVQRFAAALTPRELTDEEAERGARVMARAVWPLATEAERDTWADNNWRAYEPTARAAYRAITEEPAR